MIPILEEKREEVAAICRKYGITRLELFGSAANGDFDPERSDFDFLVEYAPGAPPLEWGGVVLREELAAVLGRKVDLVRFANIRNPYLRRSIEEHARELYYAA